SSFDGVEDGIERVIGQAAPSIGRRPWLGDLDGITGWVLGCAVADIDPDDPEPYGAGSAAGDVDFGAIEPDIAGPLLRRAIEALGFVFRHHRQRIDQAAGIADTA